MPKSRTFTVTAPASASSLLPASEANSNVPAPAGGRLPLRPARTVPTSSPTKIKRRSATGGLAVDSPVLPRTSSALFGASAADLSSASTVPPPVVPFASPTSTFDRQAPSVRFPPAAAFLSPVESVASRAALPIGGASLVSPDASTVLISPSDRTPVADGRPPAQWPRFPVFFGGQVLSSASFGAGPTLATTSASAPASDPAPVAAPAPIVAPTPVAALASAEVPLVAAVPASVSNPLSPPSAAAGDLHPGTGGFSGPSAAALTAASDAALFFAAQEYHASSGQDTDSSALVSSLPELRHSFQQLLQQPPVANAAISTATFTSGLADQLLDTSASAESSSSLAAASAAAALSDQPPVAFPPLHELS